VQHTARRSTVRTVTILILSCLTAFIALAGTSSPCIPWDVSTPIRWSMFQAIPPADAIHRNEAAAIHMTIRWHTGYSVRSNGSTWTGQITSVTVTNTMEPSLSWVVPGKADNRVLGHEQGHFDLNEVYRRKLEALLPCLQAQGATKEASIDALNAAIHQCAGEILAQLQAMQSRYDDETSHGNHSAEQARWESQIAAWLLQPISAP